MSHYHPSIVRRILPLVAALVLSGSAEALQKSKGVYRIPYADGTTVKVTNDHKEHKPIGRLDLGGRGGRAPYRIVAAADGVIRYVVDGFSGQVARGKPCTNNYVWIEHPNGEWTKYSHMRKHSTTRVAKLKVGQRVKAGTFLGYEDKVGCASGSHLHFEVGVPRASDPISRTGGFLKDNSGSKRNRIPRICGIAGGFFDSGKSYKARNVPGSIRPGAAEVARHGVKAADYQCLFDQARAAGYELAWIDGFDVRGRVYYNALFKPRGGGASAAFHGLTGSAYQAKFTQYTKNGFRPLQVESYLSGGRVRYAVIFKKVSGPRFTAYHGVSAADHQRRFDRLTARGYRPVNLSVVSTSGQRRYTALYERRDLGSWMARSFLSAADYQKQFDANRKAGRQVVYLNGYVHNGKPYFSAIFSSRSKRALRAGHGLTRSQYQQAWSANTRAGYRTRHVTGYAAGGTARYAAVWHR